MLWKIWVNLNHLLILTVEHRKCSKPPARSSQSPMTPAAMDHRPMPSASHAASPSLLSFFESQGEILGASVGDWLSQENIQDSDLSTTILGRGPDLQTCLLLMDLLTYDKWPRFDFPRFFPVSQYWLLSWTVVNCGERLEIYSNSLAGVDLDRALGMTRSNHLPGISRLGALLEFRWNHGKRKQT